MHTTKKIITRRKALQIALAIGGATLTTPIDMLNVLAEEAVLTPTPSNVLGPFYPVIKPLEKDADLTTIRGHKYPKPAQLRIVSGSIWMTLCRVENRGKRSERSPVVGRKPDRRPSPDALS